MDTPDGVRAGAGWTLYGVGDGAINRRALIASLAAVTAAGANAAPTRIARLWWRGTAHVEAGGRSLDLAVETSLYLPRLDVRSTSYIVSEGPASARTLILEPDGVWLERAGTRTALPAQLGVHERQQYAIYAWLLRVQQGRRPRPGRLALSAPPYPDIVFTIGADGYPVAAELSVASDEPGKPPIAERVAFSGRIDSSGVRWPRRFDLTRGGQPYFLLDIAAFRAG